MKKPEAILVVIPNIILHPLFADSLRSYVDSLNQQGGVINTILVIVLSLVWLMWKGINIFLIGEILSDHIFSKPAQRRFK